MPIEVKNLRRSKSREDVRLMVKTSAIWNVVIARHSINLRNTVTSRSVITWPCFIVCLADNIVGVIIGVWNMICSVSVMRIEGRMVRLDSDRLHGNATCPAQFLPQQSYLQRIGPVSGVNMVNPDRV